MIAVLLALTPLAAAAQEPSPAAPADPRYTAALELLLAGDLDAAAKAFDALAADPTAGATADRARALAEAARAMAARGRFVPDAPTAATPGTKPRKPDRRGRGELAIFSTLYGAGAGLTGAYLLELEDPKAWVGLALGGGSAGLAMAVLGTRGRAMPEGRAQAIESAATWGGFNGGMIAGLTDTESGRDVVGASAAASALALGATVWATAGRSPSAGDVAITNSGGIWGLAAGSLLLAIVTESPATRDVQATLLGAADVGLVTMALLSRNIEISRGRSLIIDAGGLLGGLTGLAIPLFAESENGRVYGVAGLAGIGTGLATAAWLTRGWDEPDAGEGRGPTALVPTVSRLRDATVVGLAGTF